MNISLILKEKVKKTINEYGMIKKGDKVLVALSGGADSVCMTHILKTLSDELGFSLSAAHLNHGIRGEDATKDEIFSREFCKNLNIPFYSKEINVVKIAEEKEISVEEAGRYERYSFFEEIKNKYGQNIVATAHNKNDMAETVLMRIIRGTGIDGLSGIKFVREDGIIRPILKVERWEIVKYCSDNKLSFCTDKTNFDNDYTRNRIRNELLPYIKENFNPNITDNLFNLSESAALDSGFINSYAHRLYKRLGSPMPNRKPVVLHIDSIKLADKAIESRLIIIAAKEAMGKDFYLEKKHIRDILSLKEKSTGASLNFAKGLTVRVMYGWLEFRNENEINKENAPGLFNDYSSVIEPGNGYKIEGRGGTVYVKRVLLSEYEKANGDVLIDEEKIQGTLTLRNRRRGDRMTVYSDGRSKRLKNLFIDMKIPRDKRDDIPLICCGNDVVAIVGSRVSEKYKIDKNSTKAWVVYYGNE